MTEYDEQVLVVDWCRLQYPKLILFHIPNGGLRHIGTAIKLKKSGVMAGVSDLFLMKPQGGKCGLFIEMKASKGRVSAQQLIFIDNARAAGYAAEVCYGFDDAKKTIENYLQS